MNAKLKRQLKVKIDEFIQEACQTNDWPDGLVHENIDLHMTQAAEAVFDATFASSKFTEKERALV